MIEFKNKFIKRLDEQVKSYTDTLVSGTISEIETYKDITGAISGLLISKQIFEDMFDKFYKSDSDFDDFYDDDNSVN